MSGCQPINTDPLDDLKERVKELELKFKVTGIIDNIIGEIGELKRKKAETELVAHHYIEVNKKLDKLESHIEELHDIINVEDRITASDILNRLTLLECHKTRQIDENRKASRRIDELQDQIHFKSGNTTKVLDSQNTWSQNIEKRLENLEEKISYIPMVRGKEGICYEMENICSQIDKLGIELNIIRTKFLCEHYVINSLNNNRKIPYKCPVCGGTPINCVTDKIEGSLIKTNNCYACEGKGVLWG